MLMNPLISVIIPVRNISKYIYESISSILKQSFENFELIVIDDNSDDATKNILNNIIDSRIKRINNDKHIGNYGCRNQGLNIARGKYVAVMDGDDIAHSDRLCKQYEFMESNPDYVAVGSDIEFISENEPSSLFERLRNDQQIKVSLLKDNVCTHPTLMLRKEILNLYNIRYSKDYFYSADYDLMVNISRLGKITNLPEALLKYRIHENQISSLKWKEQIVYADYIRINQINELKIRLSIDEVMIHLSLMKGDLLLESKLPLAEKWCNKILLKNRELDIYDECCLYSFLKERLRLSVLKSHLSFS